MSAFVPVDPLASMSPAELRAEHRKARAVLDSCVAKGRTHGARSMRQYLRTIAAELRSRAPARAS